MLRCLAVALSCQRVTAESALWCSVGPFNSVPQGMEVYRGGPSEQRSGDLSLHLAPSGLQGKPHRAPGTQGLLSPA